MIVALLGLAVGLVLALTGAGGGVLAVPLLVFVTGIGMAQAAPIGLVAVGMGAGVGALLGLRKGIVRYRAALLIAATGTLFAPLGLGLAHRIDNRWLIVLYALVLVHVASKSFRKSRDSNIGLEGKAVNRPTCVRNPDNGRFTWTAPCACALIRAGGMAGFLSGLLGVGGGFVVVPALQHSTDLSLPSAVATSLAVIFLVSLNAVWISVMNGAMQWTIALPFCAGALVGMLAGRRLAASVPDTLVHKLFGTIATLIAATMLARLFSMA